jgi:hypothetical protein
MSQEPDKVPPERPSFEDAERACAELGDQIERARNVLREYRVLIGDPRLHSDNRIEG